MAAFRRPPNLKDMVARTKLTNPLPNGGLKICTDGRCLMCKRSASTGSFESPVTGRSYKILGDTFCHTDNCIYLISCKVCGKQYVGETGDLRRKINNHLSTIKTKRIQEPVTEHFNLSGHKWQDMSVVVIDHNAHWNDTERKNKEKFWMHRLKSFRHQGMNKMNYFTKMNIA
jgi:predicted GIY-YIG superfamily endonuclease